MTLDKMVGNEIFLQGKYLSLGLNGSGTLGTRADAPMGFVSDVTNRYTRVGMVGDVDGFGTGAAATRDAMLSGLPVESFSLGYDLGSKHYTSSNSERAGTVQIGGVTSDLSSGGVARGGWSGTTGEGVKVSQVMSLADDAKYVKVEVTLINTTGADINDLRYMRTIDPDHGSSYDTINKVIEQGGDGSNGALIAAYTTGGKTPLFYYTPDDRAVVSSYGFDNHDPNAAGVLAKAQAEGFSQKGDIAINMNFGLGKLAAGASTTVTFYMGITDDVAATVKAIDAAAVTPLPVPVPTPPNTVPIAADDAFHVLSGASSSGSVLANDKDADGDVLNASLLSGPAHGALSLKADGTYSYTAANGYTGTDSFTYAASDGKASSNGKVTITVDAPNAAPVAVADSLATTGTAPVGGNVLINDTDANGDVLHASLVSACANGTLSLNADGSFIYQAKEGFSGTDSFTYAASDGQASANAKVTIVVADPMPAPVPVPDPVPTPTPGYHGVLGRGLVQDGSGATSSTLTGTAGRDTFYFDVAANSGTDTLKNFGHDDVLATSKALYGGNGGGKIGYLYGKGFSLDGPGGTDTAMVGNVKALRPMGTDADGTFIYADAAVRPKVAGESRIGDNAMLGDVSDKKGQTFFFDTALGLDLGHDTLGNFGKKDVMVTTTALAMDSHGHIALGAGGLLELGTLGGQDLGDVALSGLSNATISSLEFDGAVNHAGTTYYVYSIEGSSASTAALTF